MSYLRSVVTEALGGARLIGGEGTEYGSWTPNGVRTVVITHEAVLVEYHRPVNGGKFTRHAVNQGKLAKDFTNRIGVSDALRALYEHKAFATLEEVILDSDLQIDYSKLLSKAPDRSRLRGVSAVAWPEGTAEWFLNQAKDYREAEKGTATPGTTLLTEALGLPVISASKGPGYNDWYTRYQLVPQVYSSDQKDKPLNQYFAAVAKAYGVSDGTEDSQNKGLSTREENNVLGHRSNVLADKARIDDIKLVDAAIKRILSTKKGDKDSLKALYQGLKRCYTPYTEVSAGLGYYLATYAENDSIPAELVRIYDNADYFLQESKPSRERVVDCGGYVKVTEGVPSAFRKVFNLRRKKNTYVPDEDKFDFKAANLDLLIDLLSGESFDYVAYSERLQAAKQILTSREGTDSDELDPRIKGLRDDLARAKKDFNSPEAQKATKRIEEELDKELAKRSGADTSDLDFYKKVSSGQSAVGALYKSTLSDSAGAIVEGSWGLAQIGIKTGVAALVASEAWAAPVIPIANKILKASDSTVNYGLYTLIENIDKSAEGNRVKSESMDDQRETVLKAIFDQRVYWGIGVDLMYRFVKDSESFSKLKGRQVKRLIRSQTGVYGLGEFIDKYADDLGPHAKPFYQKYDYILLTEGKHSDDRIDVDFIKNRALHPESFYESILNDVVRMSKAAGMNRAWADGAVGPGKLAVLDTLAREGLGLPSRSYSDITVPSKPGENFTKNLQALATGDLGSRTYTSEDARYKARITGLADGNETTEGYTKALGYGATRAEKALYKRGYPAGYNPSAKVLKLEKKAKTSGRVAKGTAVILGGSQVAYATTAIVAGTAGAALPALIVGGLAAATIYKVGQVHSNRSKAKFDRELSKDMLKQGYSGNADVLKENQKEYKNAQKALKNPKKAEDTPRIEGGFGSGIGGRSEGFGGGFGGAPSGRPNKGFDGPFNSPFGSPAMPHHGQEPGNKRPESPATPSL